MGDSVFLKNAFSSLFSYFSFSSVRVIGIMMLLRASLSNLANC